MNHAGALGDAAQLAGLAVHFKGHGDLLDLGVGGHDGLGGLEAVVAQRGGQPGHGGGDGGDVQLLADDAGGGHHHVFRGDAQRRAGQAAHLLGHLDAVGVAGVGVAAVADDGLSHAVLKVSLGDGQGRALDQVGGVDAGRRRRYLGVNQRQVALFLVLADAAVNARGGKALRGTDAAGNLLHGRSLVS